MTNNIGISLKSQIITPGDDALKSAFDIVRNKHPDEDLYPLILIVEAFRIIAKREANGANVIEWYPSFSLTPSAVAAEQATELMAKNTTSR